MLYLENNCLLPSMVQLSSNQEVLETSIPFLKYQK